MSNILSALIGAFATITAVILAYILNNEETKAKLFSYLKDRLVLILSTILIIFILFLVAYICFLYFKVQAQENKIQPQQEVVNLKVIDFLLNSLKDEKVKFSSLEQRTTQITDEIDSLNLKIVKKIDEIQELRKQSLSDSAKVDSLELEIVKRKNEIESLKKEKFDLERELQRSKDELNKSRTTIKKLENDLKKEKEKLQRSVELMMKFKSVVSQSPEEQRGYKVLQQEIAWSSDKKYVAIMYYYKDVGNILILDFSSKSEVSRIPIEKVYNQIKFSSDGKKIFADDDTLKIEKELPPLSLERNLLSNDKEKNKTSKDEIKLKLKRPLFKLRSQPTTLSDEEVKAVIKKYNFFNADFNKAGVGLANQFEAHTLNGDKVVIDKATGLMWQQGGSSRDMRFTNTIKWIKEFNHKGYAGYHDWRLPTLEEAMSLMEPETKMSEQEKSLRKLYFYHNRDLWTVFIDPLFNKIPPWIWTSDLCDQKGIVLGSFAWAVYFTEGSLNNNGSYNSGYYIRAVRSGESNEKESLILKSNSVTTSSLRSNFTTLSEQEVIAMLKKYNFYESRWNQNGTGVENQYEIEIINGDTIVSDLATGLMWQQGGSFLMWQKRDLRLFVKLKDADSLIKEFAQKDDSSRTWQEDELPSFISFEETRNWIRELNRKGYAGYHDWRLPTLEEAMSLMEPETKNGYLYIDPIFNNTQVSFWTGDLVKDRSHAVWIVNFNGGFCVYQYFGEYFEDNNYIRAVRSR